MPASSRLPRNGRHSAEGPKATGRSGADPVDVIAGPQRSGGASDQCQPVGLSL